MDGHRGYIRRLYFIIFGFSSAADRYLQLDARDIVITTDLCPGRLLNLRLLDVALLLAVAETAQQRRVSVLLELPVVMLRVSWGASLRLTLSLRLGLPGCCLVLLLALFWGLLLRRLGRLVEERGQIPARLRLLGRWRRLFRHLVGRYRGRRRRTLDGRLCRAGVGLVFRVVATVRARVRARVRRGRGAGRTCWRCAWKRINNVVILFYAFI